MHVKEAMRAMQCDDYALGIETERVCEENASLASAALGVRPSGVRG